MLSLIKRLFKKEAKKKVKAEPVALLNRDECWEVYWYAKTPMTVGNQDSLLVIRKNIKALFRKRLSEWVKNEQNESGDVSGWRSDPFMRYLSELDNDSPCYWAREEARQAVIKAFYQRYR